MSAEAKFPIDSIDEPMSVPRGMGMTPDYTLELVGGLVRRRRMELALTQREVARRSGLDISSISYLERGVRRARISTIHQLAEALGCSPMDIARIVER